MLLKSLDIMDMAVWVMKALIWSITSKLKDQKKIEKHVTKLEVMV